MSGRWEVVDTGAWRSGYDDGLADAGSYALARTGNARKAYWAGFLAGQAKRDEQISGGAR